MFAVLAISHPECYCILMRNENAAREWKSNNLLRRKLSIQTKAVVVEASELEKKKKKTEKRHIVCGSRKQNIRQSCKHLDRGLVLGDRFIFFREKKKFNFLYSSMGNGKFFILVYGEWEMSQLIL